MSSQEITDPVAAVIVPKAKSIGAFDVRRTLPSAEAQTVGPFIFFDQMGPATLEGDTMLDVRPHPHIGLATLTWMLEGAIMHRDSLGYAQEIKPGEVNLMTAGHGIVHSERTPDALRGTKHDLFGVQCWLALPEEYQEIDPSFQHFDGAQIPIYERDGVRALLIMGAAWGLISPVKTLADTFFAEINLDDGAEFLMPDTIPERAVYVLRGTVSLGGAEFPAGRMVVLQAEKSIKLRALGDAQFMLIGGAHLDGPRHLYWNFASTSQERIDEAKQAWRERRFPEVPGDDQEFIPLPGEE